VSVGSGKYQTKINSSILLLRKCNLFLKENRFPKAVLDIASVAKYKNYHEIWRLLLEESVFRILLKDYSLFTFENHPKESKSNNLISMSYYECPFKFVDIESYIVGELGEDYLGFKDEPSIIEEYKQSLYESESIESQVTFRYDYAPMDYESGRHPASHMHIGFNSQIRIGCERILNPVSFVAFVIRQQYPDIWKSVVLASCISLCKSSIRDSIPVVLAKFKSASDSLEMYLS